MFAQLVKTTKELEKLILSLGLQKSSSTSIQAAAVVHFPSSAIFLLRRYHSVDWKKKKSSEFEGNQNKDHVVQVN